MGSKWDGNFFRTWDIGLSEYNHDLMKDQALRFANLPANHFDIGPQVSTTPDANKHPPASPLSAHSLSLPVHGIEGSPPSVARSVELQVHPGLLTTGYDVCLSVMASFHKYTQD